MLCLITTSIYVQVLPAADLSTYTVVPRFFELFPWALGYEALIIYLRFSELSIFRTLDFSNYFLGPLDMKLS